MSQDHTHARVRNRTQHDPGNALDQMTWEERFYEALRELARTERALLLLTQQVQERTAYEMPSRFVVNHAVVTQVQDETLLRYKKADRLRRK